MNQWETPGTLNFQEHLFKYTKESLKWLRKISLFQIKVRQSLCDLSHVFIAVQFRLNVLHLVSELLYVCAYFLFRCDIFTPWWSGEMSNFIAICPGKFYILIRAIFLAFKFKLYSLFTAWTSIFIIHILLNSSLHNFSFPNCVIMLKSINFLDLCKINLIRQIGLVMRKSNYYKSWFRIPQAAVNP